MKRYQIIIGFAVMVFSLVAFNTYGQESTSYRKGTLTSYVFYVPVTWEVGGSAEEQHMRGMLSVDSRYKIIALSTFSMPEGAIVTVYELGLPAGEGATYIEKLSDLNIEKFRTGKSNGLVKEVLENRKTKRGSFEALLLDWESTRGGLPHSRQWVLHHSEQKVDKVVVIVAFCNSRGYNVGKGEIDRIASTLHVKTDK